jgi:hypothetical protein
MVLSFFGNSKPKENRFGTRSGALIATQSYKDKADRIVGDNELISENEYNKAYRNKNTGDISIGIRGTSGLSDVLTDVKHFIGSDIRNTDRYKNSKTFLEKVKGENPNSKVNLYGHSLGALITNKLAEEKPNLVSGGEGYNPYALKGADLESGNKIKNYRLRTDVASALGSITGNVKSVGDFSDLTKGVLEAHSLSNFLRAGGMVRKRRRRII